MAGLRKVQEYYRRHPDAQGRFKSDLARLLESDDPEVTERLCAGVPFSEMQLPPDQQLVASADVGEDAEVLEYLRHNDFALGPRMAFVASQVARLKGSVGAVPCPHGHAGRLHVPAGDWDEFTAGDAVTLVSSVSSGDSLPVY